MANVLIKLSKVNDNLEKIPEEVKDVVIVTKYLNLTEELIEGLHEDTRVDSSRQSSNNNFRRVFSTPVSAGPSRGPDGSSNNINRASPVYATNSLW